MDFQKGNKYKAIFREYALSHHREDILQILQMADEYSHFAVEINFVHLFEESTYLGDGILSNPRTVLPLCDAALVEAQNHQIEKEGKIFRNPSLYGMYVVKLAVAIVITGGAPHVDDSGIRTRAEAHLLIVGDPGTGKSEILRFVAELCPRSAFTSGVGSTSAVLTVSAVRENGEWQLEAGALLLTDGGVICIDDFNSIREHDRTAIHEAMEKQTISVAKAGLVCKLRTRCKIIAATNPKGKYDPFRPTNVNVAISSPLLSQFDLVIILVDSQNQEWDRIVSDFILSNTRGFKKETLADGGTDDIWSTEKLRSYFSTIQRISPQMSANANLVLTSYYKAQRIRNAARTTLRLFESIIRLAEAHARLMFREEATVLDAIVSVIMVENSMQGASLVSEAHSLHTLFPEDPSLEYVGQATSLLTTLGLHDVLGEELERVRAQEKGRVASN